MHRMWPCQNIVGADSVVSIINLIAHNSALFIRNSRNTTFHDLHGLYGILEILNFMIYTANAGKHGPELGVKP